MKRYFLDQDNSGHWYFVEADKRCEWHDWLVIPEDDERSWTAPKFAFEIGGAPQQLTFCDPQYV
jgi:hypothetical protein